MTIHAHRRSDGRRHLAGYRRIAVNAVQRRFGRRGRFGTLRTRFVPERPSFARTRRISVATAAGMLALVLGLWSTPAASASKGFSAARARSGSHGRQSMPAWLTTINRYRAAAGVAAVRDQPAWDVGLEHHLTYLNSPPLQYLTGQYQSHHTENPASPYYSVAGSAEASYSDLVQGAAFTPSEP